MSIYDHSSLDKKWQERWQTHNVNELNLFGVAKPFYNLMMFPYPSAEGLHVGNMYAFTGSDIYGRFKRMQGYDVFEPIGLDGFGIHSENFALKIGRHPMQHAEITQKNYYAQLRKIGAMFDWSRTVETYNPDYYRWTQWLFTQMFKHGLAYRDRAEVNFCPSCKTVLADEQVIDELCERCGNKVEKRSLEQWFFRITAYAGKLLENSFSLDWSEKVRIAQQNWIGKKEGVVIHHNVDGMDIRLDAFSAYPAWLFADTFLVIAPEHPVVETLIAGVQGEERIKQFIQDHKVHKSDAQSKEDEKQGIFIGRYVIDPFSGNKMPVWLANFALMGFGTGIIRCSAHDPRDFEFAQKYGISLKEVVKRTDPKVPIFAHENTGILLDSGPFSGKSISPELIEDMVDWIVNENIGVRETTYHLRDWLISRQRYWGPPIPMIYCKTCAKENRSWFTTEEAKSLNTELGILNTDKEKNHNSMNGWYPVPDDQLPVVLPRIEDYKPGTDGIAPLAKHKEFYETHCPGCGGKAVRETDVSDTFLDSSWYFLRYPSVGVNSNVSLPWDPKITKKWLPVDMYTGGAEHSVLHLMYSRFVTMALKDWGYIDFEEPFQKFFAHGLVIKDGAKMSKSKGNVVNPDEYIKLYGADALRLYLMFMGPFDQGGDFRDTAMEGMSRWINRVWHIGETRDRKQETSKKVMQALHKLMKKVGDDLEKRRYNTAIASMMEFTNLVADEDGAISKGDFLKFVLILAPFAPHMTEELWQKLNYESGILNTDKTKKKNSQFTIHNSQFRSVHTQSWPAYDESLLQDETVTVVVQVNGKMRDSLSLDRESAFDTTVLESRAKLPEKVKRHIDGKTIRRIVTVPGKLVNIVV